MDTAAWTAIAAIVVALINMVGSVLLTWVRAHYRVDTHVNGSKPPAPPGPTST